MAKQRTWFKPFKQEDTLENEQKILMEIQRRSLVDIESARKHIQQSNDLNDEFRMESMMSMYASLLADRQERQLKKQSYNSPEVIEGQHQVQTEIVQFEVAQTNTRINTLQVWLSVVVM